ncbi:helix-turn-helix domain-containing protein [Enterococcus sp. CSURQ0835]|uniref:helix-turn-helix domain-containing protein n=1 Tax=Enterococcus sp. CSURQ0835 TaxID=2681394 RepID=UPI00135CE9A5|nr:helix-turn-helix domain-containing protein [Enterococcus sp. CSURQ0835]
MDLFILTLFASGYKLRISTLYQLLTGRRTSSVLLHGFFYDNLNVCGLLPDLKNERFKRAIAQLEKNGWITRTESFGQLTTSGQAELAQHDFTPLVGLNSFRYGRMRQECWQLLNFGIQVLSFLAHGQKDYVPLENRPLYLTQVKHFLAQAPADLLEKFPQELTALFAKLPEASADFLANQLTGFQQNGQTAFQLLPSAWQNTPWDKLYTASQQDLLLAHVRQFPSLYPLIVAADQKNYNHSMLLTRQLFLAGDSVKAIMTKRQLKEGTITDHLLEWALLDANFPFERFELATGVTGEAVRDLQYQDFDVSYLNFRLSQIKEVKQTRWN